MIPYFQSLVRKSRKGCYKNCRILLEEKMIGKKVTVKIDRPMGSYHPKHKDIYYP